MSLLLTLLNILLGLAAGLSIQEYRVRKLKKDHKYRISWEEGQMHIEVLRESLWEAWQRGNENAKEIKKHLSYSDAVLQTNKRLMQENQLMSSLLTKMPETSS